MRLTVTGLLAVGLGLLTISLGLLTVHLVLRSTVGGLLTIGGLLTVGGLSTVTVSTGLLGLSDDDLGLHALIGVHLGHHHGSSLVALANTGTNATENDEEEGDPKEPPAELGPSVAAATVVVVVVTLGAVLGASVVQVIGVVDVVTNHINKLIIIN